VHHCAAHESIPDDIALLAKLTHIPLRKTERLWANVRECFAIDENKPNRLMHRQVEIARELRRQYIAKKSEAGKKGAEATHGRGDGANGIAKAELGQSQSAAMATRRDVTRRDEIKNVRTNLSHFHARLTKAGLAPSIAGLAIQQGVDYAEDCLAFLRRPSDDIDNPEAFITDRIQHKQWPPKPKPEPLTTEEQDLLLRWRAENRDAINAHMHHLGLNSRSSDYEPAVIAMFRERNHAA